MKFLEETKNTINLIKSDFWASVGPFSGKKEMIRRIAYTLLAQEYYPVLIYRLGKWNRRVRIPILHRALNVLYFFANKFCQIFCGVGIWLNAEIGPGFQILHYGGIYIEARIGANCRVAQQVVIGYAGGDKGGVTPKLGDNVWVGSGAKILGDIKIGNNVYIGANAVVTKDLPDNAVAVGIPAKVVKFRNR